MCGYSPRAITSLARLGNSHKITIVVHSLLFTTLFLLSSNIGRVVAELHFARSNEDPIRGKRVFSLDDRWKTDP